MKDRISNRFVHESLVHLEVFRLVEEKHPHSRSFKSGKNPHIKFFRIKYYLLARGMELSMKAFLFDHGIKLSALKKIGHNIKKLAQKSKDKGLSILSAGEMGCVMLLNQIYSNKGLEYENNIFRLPNLNELEEIAAKIIDAVQKEEK